MLSQEFVFFDKFFDNSVFVHESFIGQKQSFTSITQKTVNGYKFLNFFYPPFYLKNAQKQPLNPERAAQMQPYGNSSIGCATRFVYGLSVAFWICIQ